MFNGGNLVSKVGGIQLFATFKNGLKFFHRKKLMRSTITAEEELTYKVLAGFKDDFAMSGMGRSLDVLLEEGVDALATISAVANFDRMTMVAKMNAGTLSGVIAMDVEDSGMTWCNAFGRLLTNPAHKSGMQRQGTTNVEGLLGESIKINVIHIGGPMSTLEVITLRIWTLEVANASGGAKKKANVIGDIGGLGLGPNMAVIAFVHAFHGFGFRMRGRDTNWGEHKHTITIKPRGEETHLFNLQGVIIQLLEDVFTTGHGGKSTKTLQEWKKGVWQGMEEGETQEAG